MAYPTCLPAKVAKSIYLSEVKLTSSPPFSMRKIFRPTLHSSPTSPNERAKKSPYYIMEYDVLPKHTTYGILPPPRRGVGRCALITLHR